MPGLCYASGYLNCLFCFSTIFLHFPKKSFLCIVACLIDRLIDKYSLMSIMLKYVYFRIRHYLSLHDVQMMAMISCLLEYQEIGEKVGIDIVKTIVTGMKLNLRGVNETRYFKFGVWPCKVFVRLTS